MVGPYWLGQVGHSRVVELGTIALGTLILGWLAWACRLVLVNPGWLGWHGRALDNRLVVVNPDLSASISRLELETRSSWPWMIDLSLSTKLVSEMVVGPVLVNCQAGWLRLLAGLELIGLGFFGLCWSIDSRWLNQC